MNNFWKEPFLHFVLIGAALFVLYGIVNDDVSIDDNTILVSQGKIENLKMMFGKTWQRSPTEEELEGLIEDHLKEEVFYREALRMGLDGDDIIIRRRMRQKMEFVAEDFASVMEPSVEELEEYLKEHHEKFDIPPLYSFRHVYLNPERHGGEIEETAAELIEALNKNDVEFENLGDPLMIEKRYVDAEPFQIRRAFGDRFEMALVALPVGQWTGPVFSGFGLHAVVVDKVVPGRPSKLEEVRPEVERELMNDRRLETLEAFYQGLRSNYEVVIEEDGDLDQKDSK